MKRKIGIFFTFLIMIVLFSGIIFFAYAIYKDLIGEDAVEKTHTDNIMVAVDNGIETIDTNKTEKRNLGEAIVDIFTPSTSEEQITYSTENSVGKYFYEQLNEVQKSIYNGLQENKDKLVSGKHTIEFGNKFYDLLSQENGDKVLGDDYQAAIEAFTHDNPDLFYIDVSKMYLNMETKKRAFKTTYNVYIKPESEKNYYAKGFTSEAQVKKAINQMERQKEYIKSKLTQNNYNNIKLIHDYLIDNIKYDENDESIGKYSIYGALIEKKCVCEGYARSFEYFADAAGIENVFMQGTATNKEGQTENHAWNAVKLQGKWYLVDVTWDDPIIVGNGRVSSNVHYQYFLKGAKTFYKDHKLETQFTEGGKVFDFPNISLEDY